jgi:membrane protease YdiL (CAAX protease family)
VHVDSVLLTRKGCEKFPAWQKNSANHPFFGHNREEAGGVSRFVFIRPATRIPIVKRILIAWLLVLTVVAGAAHAQEALTDSMGTTRSEITGLGRFGHEWLLPFGSVLVPGLGQWANGAVGDGFAFFGAAFVGALIAAYNEDASLTGDSFPRTRSAQVRELGLQLAGDAGLLSGYDSFKLSLPKLQVGGHYEFIEKPTPTSKAFAAPFRFGFLKNKRTWIVLTIPVAIVAAVAIDQRGVETLPFKPHDAVYAAGVSYGAGVTEEAFFRGYLFPVFHELSHERAWVSNPVQALLFGLAHAGQVEVPVFQTIAGLYWGWVVQKNDWDFQETIFQHFWWDAILITGALLLDDGGDTRLSLALPTIRF